MNTCLHRHICMNCGAARDCTRPECRKLLYFDVCTIPCQTPGTLRPYGLGKTARRIALPVREEGVA